jgi:hypothetical protein
MESSEEAKPTCQHSPDRVKSMPGNNIPRHLDTSRDCAFRKRVSAMSAKRVYAIPYSLYTGSDFRLVTTTQSTYLKTGKAESGAERTALSTTPENLQEMDANARPVTAAHSCNAKAPARTQQLSLNSH